MEKQVNPTALSRDGMVIYYADNAKFFTVLKVIGIITALVVWMVYQMGFRSIAQLNDAIYAFIMHSQIYDLLIVGLMVFLVVLIFGWAIMKVICDYLKGRFQAKVAINFDQCGILVLNDRSFSLVYIGSIFVMH